MTGKQAYKSASRPKYHDLVSKSGHNDTFNLAFTINHGWKFQWQFLFVYVFSLSPRLGASYITGPWGEFRVISTALYLLILLLLLLFLLLFFTKRMRFYQFYFFFRWSIKFLKQNINQSKTGIGDKKLSVELYGRHDCDLCGQHADNFDDIVRNVRENVFDNG